MKTNHVFILCIFLYIFFLISFDKTFTYLTFTLKKQVQFYPLYYENMRVQYIANFCGCKNENFHFKCLDFFLILAQNIDCEAVLRSTHNLCIRAKVIKNVYACIHHFFRGL